MATTTTTSPLMPANFASFATALSLLVISTFLQGVYGAVGVNYGTVADNLPPPSEVAHFLLESTTINHVRLFDANPDILRAFAHTGIVVTVTIPNDQIPRLTKPSAAHEWLKTNIQPHVPDTDIVRILVGNEVLSTANKLLVASLVPALQALHASLVDLNLDRRIKLTTPHSLGILSTSAPPSTGKFRQGYDTHVLKPLLGFLRATDSPFMINPYPFFSCSAETLDYALFKPNSGMVDDNTQLNYTNMLDAQLDAVFSAMKGLGFADLELVIAETGWPSVGDQAQVGVDPTSAAEYNGNLVRHVTSGVGAPLMPNRTFETYIFALFNEDRKPGPTCESNFGLFRPNLTPVYDVGILRPTVSATVENHPKTCSFICAREPDRRLRHWVMCRRTWGQKSGGVCPKQGLTPNPCRGTLTMYGLGLDCGPSPQGGPCFAPNTVRAHAAYAMNVYYQVMGRNGYDCDFGQTGAISDVDPSYGRCKY